MKQGRLMNTCTFMKLAQQGKVDVGLDEFYDLFPAIEDELQEVYGTQHMEMETPYDDFLQVFED